MQNTIVVNNAIIFLSVKTVLEIPCKRPFYLNFITALKIPKIIAPAIVRQSHF